MAEYTEDNIRSLDWKEHIRLRPGMYIGKLGDGTQVIVSNERPSVSRRHQDPVARVDKKLIHRPAIGSNHRHAGMKSLHHAQPEALPARRIQHRIGVGNKLWQLLPAVHLVHSGIVGVCMCARGFAGACTCVRVGRKPDTVQ